MGPRARHARNHTKTRALPIALGSFVGFIFVFFIAFAIGMMGNINRWLSDLPDYTSADSYLTSEPTTILDASGNEIASLFVQNRQSVSNDKISPYALKGIVDVEDERFYEHNGVDLIGIVRAVVSHLTGGSEGGSTITQQLVRNTILSEEQFDDTIERKVREAYIAMQMEKIFSKQEILNMYLNTIYYGHGAYGIQAASQTYFSKDADQLSLAEAALIVGLPNSPSNYDPTINPDGAISRRNKVLDNMLRRNDITQEEYDQAKATPLELHVSEQSASGAYAYPYFVDYVKALLQEQFSTDVLYAGGLTIKTTIDPTIQAAAEKAATEQLAKVGADDLEVGMTVIDPSTGYIKAMVGGRDYASDANHVNHATSRRAAGSAFKAFTLATAIKEGMNPDILINCTSSLKITDEYTVHNIDNENFGVTTLAQATAVSSNTGYVQVAEAVGNQNIIDTCADLGIDTKAAGLDPSAASMTLGAMNNGISPLEMAEAYATFAAGGKHRGSVAITEILSRDGSVLYQHKDSYNQALDPGVAQAVNEVLEGVMTGRGTGIYGNPSINEPVAGKTGTAGGTSDATDLWFCGYTPQLSTAIWVGHSGSNSPIRYFRNYNTTLPIFEAFAEDVLGDAQRKEFPTGQTPEYKDNSEWDFIGGNYNGSRHSSSNSSQNSQSSSSQTTQGTASNQQGTQTPVTPGANDDTSDGSTSGSTGGTGTGAGGDDTTTDNGGTTGGTTPGGNQDQTGGSSGTTGGVTTPD